MSDKLNLANIQKNKEQKEMEELSKQKMSNITGYGGGTPEEEMEKECCLMFCQITLDSTGELLFFIL